MIVLIVGPSGVGKSATYKAAEGQCPDIIFRHLDGLAAQWAVDNHIINDKSVTLLSKTISNPDLFLLIGLHAIGKLAGENPNHHLVIDVGAGFQESRTAAQLHRIFTVVAITADPNVAYDRIKRKKLKRNEKESRSAARYKRQEYAPHRKAVYDSAHFTIDSSNQTEQQTLDEFIQILCKIFARPIPPSSENQAAGSPQR